MQQPQITERPLTTAWIPLEGLAEQWGHFSAQAASYPCFQATSTIFSALTHESEAFDCHIEAWHPFRHGDQALLQSTLDHLRQAWTEAFDALEQVLHHTFDISTFQQPLLQVAEQRVRLATLIVEVEREHLHAVRSNLFSL